MTTPDHLGGHCNVTKINQPVLIDIQEKYKVKSLIDIGCGPGGMKVLCDKLNIDWYGIDGDPEVMKTTDHSLLYDFTEGTPVIDREFDIAWSTEFLEHIEEKYIPNFLPLFQKAKIVCCSAGLPGWPGHNHVNCQPPQYWIDVFKDYGFEYDDEYTNHLKSISVPERVWNVDKNIGGDRSVKRGDITREGERKNFFKLAGLFFTKI